MSLLLTDSSLLAQLFVCTGVLHLSIRYFLDDADDHVESVATVRPEDPIAAFKVVGRPRNGAGGGNSTILAILQRVEKYEVQRKAGVSPEIPKFVPNLILAKAHSSNEIVCCACGSSFVSTRRQKKAGEICGDCAKVGKFAMHGLQYYRAYMIVGLG